MITPSVRHADDEPATARDRRRTPSLGGKDTYQIDREAGDASLKVWPALRVHMRANREFMHRSARYLAVEKGIRQFLDIGTGIPTSPNLHEVVQDVAPDSRVVDDDEAYEVVRRVVDVLPSGSYLAASIATDDFNPEVLAQVGREYAARGEPIRLRGLPRRLRHRHLRRWQRCRICGQSTQR